MPLTHSRRAVLQGIAAGTAATAFGSPAFARQATPAIAGRRAGALQGTITAVGAGIAAAGVAAQLGASDISATDATAMFADLPWYTMTTAFLALALDAPADRLSALDVWDDVQFAINPDGSPSDKVNPSGMGNFAAQFAEGLDFRLATAAAAIDLTAADQITVMTDQGPLTAPGRHCHRAGDGPRRPPDR